MTYDGERMENSSPTLSQSSPTETGCLKGCLIALVVGIGLLVAAICSFPYLEEYQHNKYVTEKATDLYNAVKAGSYQGMVFDPLMVEMLANDEQCIANLTYLYFVDIDLSDPRYKAVAKLKNLRSLEFYDCENDEKLLDAIKGMPSVEEMEFDSMRESEERERLLKTFPNLKKVTYE